MPGLEIFGAVGHASGRRIRASRCAGGGEVFEPLRRLRTVKTVPSDGPETTGKGQEWPHERGRK